MSPGFGRRSEMSRAGSRNSRAGSKRRETGFRSESVRQILIEAFRLFRDIDLNERALKELEDKVFATTFTLSPRDAAKQILRVMDEFRLSDLNQDLGSPRRTVR